MNEGEKNMFKTNLFKKMLAMLCTVALLLPLVPVIPGLTVQAEAVPSGWIGADDTLTIGRDGGRVGDVTNNPMRDGLLYNQKGQEVVLRGVNLGSWMLQESWMAPVYGTDRAWANLDTIHAFENQGWTAAQIQQMFDQYQDNWITVDDFDLMKSMGMNSIRIPFWYRNFMSDEAGTWINGDNGSLDDTKNPGFKRLDWAITQAKKRGIYVILDLHGAVGGQSMDHCSGTLGKNELYTNPMYEQATVDLWRALAARYKDEPTVAAYDLLNEPQNNGGYTGPNSWTPGSQEAIFQTIRMYDRLYKEVREEDPNTIVIMEGIWSMNMPDPLATGTGDAGVEYYTLNNNGSQIHFKVDKENAWDKNVMYSMHLYDKGVNLNNPPPAGETVNYRVFELTEVRRKYGVAVHVGEFNNDQAMSTQNANATGFSNVQDYAFHLYNTQKISWNVWTYKVGGSNQGNWSLRQNRNLVNVDPHVHDYDAVMQHWGEALRTFQPGTQTLTSGYTIQGMDTMYRAGQNQEVEGVFTNSNQAGFPAGGEAGPILVNDDETGSGLVVDQVGPPEGFEDYYHAGTIGDNSFLRNNPEPGWMRYEAEDPDAASIHNSSSAASVEDQSFYSGGKAAGGLNKSGNISNIDPALNWDTVNTIAYVKFRVNVSRGGKYLIRIRYNGDDDKSILVKANNGAHKIVSLPRQRGGQWDAAFFRQVDLQLNPGINTVWVSGVVGSGWANIDCIDIRNERLFEGGTSSIDKVAGSVSVTYSSELYSDRPQNHWWVQNDYNDQVKYKMSPQPDIDMQNTVPNAATNFTVNPDMEFQTMHGIGTSIEGTTVGNLKRMSPEDREAVLRTWFDPVDGLGYSWIRIECGTSDFTEPATDYGAPNSVAIANGGDGSFYTYADGGDPNFTEQEAIDFVEANFSIQKKKDGGHIDILKEIVAINPDIKFLLSPWSPPGWMKGNGSMWGGDNSATSETGANLRPKFYKACALMYAKAVEAYAAEGIKITEFTTNNETRVRQNNYPSALFNSTTEYNFAAQLKGAFKAKNLDVKVLILDHNPQYTSDALASLALDRDEAGENVIDGVAFHDYGGNLTEMARIAQTYPDMIDDVYFTERAVWGMTGANRIMQYMKNGCNSYMSWVSMCDSNQWPNAGPYVGAEFDHPLAVRKADPKDSSYPNHSCNDCAPTSMQSPPAEDTAYWFTPETYIIGQYAKYVKPGAKRIHVIGGEDAAVSAIAFTNPDGSQAVVAVNRTGSAQDIKFTVTGQGQFADQLPPGTMATYTWDVSDAEGAPARPVIAPGTTEFETAANPAVTITCPTEGADIYYTTDGTAPTGDSAKYDGPFNVPVAVDGTVRIRAAAYKDGKASPIAAVTYSVRKTEQPAFSTTSRPTGPFDLILSCDEDGAEIWYTLNGGMETRYEGPITIMENTTVTAWALKAGLSKSGIISHTYTFSKPSKMYHSFETITEITAGTSTSISGVASDWAYSVNNKALEMTLTGTSQSPNNTRRIVNIPPETGQPFDTTEYEYMVVVINDRVGDNGIWVRFNSGSGFWANDRGAIEATQNTWTQIAISTANIPASLTSITIGEWNNGSYWIDSIYFVDHPDDLPPRDLTDITNNNDITAVVTETLTYNGEAQRPAFLIKEGGTALTEGEHYDLIGWQNNINAGEASVLVSGRKEGGYTGIKTVTFSIEPKALTITGVTAANRTYDGTTAVTLSGGTLAGIKSGDTVNFTLGNGKIANANVGNNKAVTTAITLSGASAGNYTLTQPAGLTVNITPKALTITGVTAINRAYDGTMAVALTGGTLVGIESGDTVNFTLGSGTIANANVGNNKAVSTVITLSGTSADNYTLIQPADITVNIMAGTFTVTFNGNGGRIGKNTTVTRNVVGNGTVVLPAANEMRLARKIFDGWFTHRTGGSRVTGTPKVTGNITYYAHWKSAKPARPKKPRLSNPKAGRLRIAGTRVKGLKYEIQYATNKKFTRNKKRMTKFGTAKKLKKGTVYYVRVRTYRNDSTGKRVNSRWSKSAKLKLKR